MNTFKKLALAAGLCAAGLSSHDAFAQTTDGYHTIQVFPVVVDTASFTQRFTFRNPNATTIHISPSYYPGTGTAQATPLSCSTFTIAANSDRTFTSLRSICGALAVGSNFGFLYTYETDATNMPYAGFSRVANPQGNGFSVEAFPAHTFTAAETAVAGVRRLAASGGNPAFQTNCFVANLNDITPPGAPVNSTVAVRAYNSSNVQVGSTTNVVLSAGKLTRMLDVFDYVGAPAGNYDNARVTFEESGTGEPGIMAFCTVQANTSYGADFRIAKQEEGFSDALGGFYVGAQDDHVLRNSTVSSDVTTTYGTRTFKLLTGGSRHNTHIMYFRHPDWVQCEVIDPATGVRALSGYGLEMRMVASDGVTVVAGGNGSTGWGETYLGDKTDRDNGVNSRYTIEVENSSGNLGPDLPYRLHCQSGSGHTVGEMVEYGVADEDF